MSELVSSNVEVGKFLLIITTSFSAPRECVDVTKVFFAPFLNHIAPDTKVYKPQWFKPVREPNVFYVSNKYNCMTLAVSSLLPW